MRNVILEELDKATELLQYFTGSTVITQADMTYTAANIGSGLAVGDTVVIAGAVDSASNGTFVLTSVASGAIIVAASAIGANETATITINQQWQGVWKEIQQFSHLVGAINSSGNATLYIEQSSNGVDTDYISPDSSGWAVTGGTAMGYSTEVVLPYGRIRIKTSAADQTTMRAFFYGRKIT